MKKINCQLFLLRFVFISLENTHTHTPSAHARTLRLSLIVEVVVVVVVLAVVDLFYRKTFKTSQVEDAINHGCPTW